MNLLGQIRSVDLLFGKRNRLYIQNRSAYFDYLLDNARMLLKILRRGSSAKMEDYADVLTNIFGWTCALAYSFGELPIVEAICIKYPVGGCTYCGEKICKCTLNRVPGESKIVDTHYGQGGWTITEFVKHIDDTYGKVNHQNGLQTAVLRLVEEILEIQQTLLVDYREPELSPEELMRRIAKEFADTFAWIFAIAALCEIDLQHAVETRYGGVHSGCGKRPCMCGEVDWSKQVANSVPVK